ncbi:MAG: methionyl-tRNA formyltransferase [Prevotellaceae bacterium]|jgi:methionyl-tRNA formyltransferase|nr:methionyl-tRNA formyltransferase [Prevotellaceae bacterium]
MGNTLRIIYMGTPDFAVEPLRQIINAEIRVVAVITVPDKPAGRGQKLQQSPVKQFALQNNLPVLQPERLRDENFLAELKSFHADLFIVVAFRMLPEAVWSMPPKGTINLHASLLPQYRGAAPINRAIIDGETTTGVTSFFITHEIDTGNILLQDNVTISEKETAGKLHDKLMIAGAKLLVTTIQKLSEGTITANPQVNTGKLKPAPKLFKNDCRINWNADVRQIYNLIRGLHPYPTAWSEMISGKESISVKIYESETEEQEHQYLPGTIISDGKIYLKVACTNGFIHINSLQLAGKKQLPIQHFLIGFKRINEFSFK